MRLTACVPTRLVFGDGILDELKNQPFPGKKPLLVFDDYGGEGRSTPVCERVLAQLQQAGLKPVCHGLNLPISEREAVMRAARAARDGGCDFILGLGENGVIDTAKGAACMAANPGDLWDYAQEGTGGRKAVQFSPLPTVCIPTTSGYGAELSHEFTVTNGDTHERIVFGGDDRFHSRMTIYDPEVMMAASPVTTACSGFDALFRAAASCLSTKANLLSETYAVTALKNIGTYLGRAVRDGTDLEARERLAFAGIAAALASDTSSGLGWQALMNAMYAEHPTMPNGLGSLMLAQASFGYLISKHIAGSTFIMMARALGMEMAEKPADFTAELLSIHAACGLDKETMSSFGIKEEDLSGLADKAFATGSRLFADDPLPMSHDECVGVYRQSYS